jgi:hypothetical protein
MRRGLPAGLKKQSPGAYREQSPADLLNVLSRVCHEPAIGNKAVLPNGAT